MNDTSVSGREVLVHANGEVFEEFLSWEAAGLIERLGTEVDEDGREHVLFVEADPPTRVEVLEACLSLEADGLIERIGTRKGKDGREEILWAHTGKGVRDLADDHQRHSDDR
jgi:hypothetical protein